MPGGTLTGARGATLSRRASAEEPAPITSNVLLSSVRIQAVLFHPEPGQVERLLRGMGNSVRMAKSQNKLKRVHVAIGDCSSAPSLGDESLTSLKHRTRIDGIDDFSFEFFDANLGSAAGNNRLLVDSTEDFILFLNPDTFASPQMLLELALPLRDERVGVVEARQLPLEHPKYFDPVSGDTSWASMAASLVRREVIEVTDGFDADAFFLYCDDVDLSWRARLAGFRVVHQPSARVFHDKRLTTDGRIVATDSEIYYAAEAALMLAWKYSRPKLVTQWLRNFSNSPVQSHRKVAQSFRARAANRTLPTPIDPEGRVAEFIDGNYARHRFSYND
jgi:GT2 family glycosyltransferase